MYDIFLGGPFEKYDPDLSFKRTIKQAFPDLKIFDPEYDAGPEWFADNYRALAQSRSMVAYLPPKIAVPAVLQEIGIFYALHQKTLASPMDEIIIIWPQELPTKPSGISAMRKYGRIVATAEEAVGELKKIF
jgi:hypothetical protein